MEERTAHLQRQLLLAQSELKTVKEDAHIQELDKAHLQTQLSGDLCRMFDMMVYCATVWINKPSKVVMHALWSMGVLQQPHRLPTALLITRCQHVCTFISQRND